MFPAPTPAASPYAPPLLSSPPTIGSTRPPTGLAMTPRPFPRGFPTGERPDSIFSPRAFPCGARNKPEGSGGNYQRGEVRFDGVRVNLHLPSASSEPLRSDPMMPLLVFHSLLRSWGFAAPPRRLPRGILPMTSLCFGVGRGILMLVEFTQAECQMS